MFNSIHEECGVFGIFMPKTCNIAEDVYLALYALQHRGQESCGIAVNDDGCYDRSNDQWNRQEYQSFEHAMCR